MKEKENKTLAKNLRSIAARLGEYAVAGGPGRPPGMKNKFTLLKETLLDTFNNHHDKREALERTLFYKREDGLEYVNLEALRAILGVLPKVHEDEDDNATLNFNLAINQFGKLSIDELKSIAALARTEKKKALE